jgi:hypothetical protein
MLRSVSSKIAKRRGPSLSLFGNTNISKFLLYYKAKKSPVKSIRENGFAGLLTLLHSWTPYRILNADNCITADFFVKEKVTAHFAQRLHGLPVGSYSSKS